MTLPPDFEEDVVASVPLPTALAFAPDDRMLVTTKPGQLWLHEDGQEAPTLALDLGPRVCANSERGLLGVAVDPGFETNGYVYLYYTYKKHGRCPQKDPGNRRNPVNRVSRFVVSGDTVDPTSEQVLIDNIPSPNGNHNAGYLHFGKDGNLYVSVGDGGCSGPKRCQYKNNASRKRHVLLGKVLRIEPDGDIPPDNPHTDPDTSDRCNQTGRTVRGHDCQETFARGFRNPFRMAFDPDTPGTTTRFFINDVGGRRWEEIDEGEAGADYGWNLCEGSLERSRADCSEPPFTPPIHEYSHGSGCQSITGGAFVPDGFWPAEYNDAYLFGDFVCHKIFVLKPTGGGSFESELFADGVGQGGPIAMTFGPYMTTGKALYYTTFAEGGQVRRITYTG